MAEKKVNAKKGIAGKPKALSEDQQRKMALDYLKSLDAGRRNYIKAGKLLEGLREGGVEAGQDIALGGGRKVTMTDNFAEKDAHYKNVRVQRYDLVQGFVD